MDNLGAIAICTEPFDKKRETNPGLNKRVSRSNPIIGPDMWRTILCQAAYQLLVMIIFMFFGMFMFSSETYNLITAPIDNP
jgi:Ca2+ transporting ATPase